MSARHQAPSAGQDRPPFAAEPTLGSECQRLLAYSNQSKGTAFEKLLVHALPRIRETEIRKAWRWADVPNRKRRFLFPNSQRNDTGVDIIAERHDGKIIAIQAKCYNPSRRLQQRDINNFLAMTGDVASISRRWVVTTCSWSRNVARAFHTCTFIHAPSQWGSVPLGGRRSGERHTLDSIQCKAYEACVEGLQNHDRGQLIMACGTGKTLVSQRIAEALVPNRGLLIYATPSIGLAAQSRREWLRQANRHMRTVVVCSDESAGSDDTGDLTEFEAPVSTDPQTISNEVSKAYRSLTNGYVAVFTTYQSMDKLCLAQADFALPDADLVIADEAHKTTGLITGTRAKIWQKVHRELRARKRLYQTATPRIFSRRSTRRILDGLNAGSSETIEVVDMSNDRIYGPELFRLRFTEALDAPDHERRLCDYRVIVVLLEGTLRVPTADATLNVKNTTMATRMAGLSLVMAGADSVALEYNSISSQRIGDIRSCIAFCNRLDRARWARNTIGDHRLTSWARMQALQSGNEIDETIDTTSGYLDGKSNAVERFTELERLRTARQDDRRHVTTNVRVLSEGINVPALDAICMLEERKSEIDIVQAVGRVMRRPPDGDKELGYIIVPVIMDPQLPFEETLSEWDENWRVLGQTLRSLRAHDERIETDLEERVIITTKPPSKKPSTGGGSPPDFWEQLKDGKFNNLLPKVMEKSGLKRDTREQVNLIKKAVQAAASTMNEETGLGKRLRNVTGIEDSSDIRANKRACAAGALLLTNALLMHQRIRELTTNSGKEELLALTPLSTVKAAQKPEGAVIQDWSNVLQHDYKPIFEPALEVVTSACWAGTTVEGMRSALRTLARHCEEIAHEYAQMGMDHAGELFQAAMDNPDADGAYYTLTPSAMLLAELACDAVADPDDERWRDPETWKRNVVLDPACGSGTLLTAIATAIRRRAEGLGTSASRLKRLTTALIEDSLTGFDVNSRAVQIAASQLAIGSSDTNLRRIGLWTLPRGTVSADGRGRPEVRLGSLELLNTYRDGTYRGSLLKGIKDENQVVGQRVRMTAIEKSRGLQNRLKKTVICISNPPYSNSAKEAGNLSQSARNALKKRKAALRDTIATSGDSKGELRDILNPNSISPWFTVLMEETVDPQHGVIAKVMPTTACTTVEVAERQFWSRQFHVSHVLTLHHPKDLNWSVDTDITESLMIVRRDSDSTKPTKFISLRKRPRSPEEALELHERIRDCKLGEWGELCVWPSERVQAGDWSPVVWYNPTLSEVGRMLEELVKDARWTRLGTHWRIQTTKQLVGQNKWQWCNKRDSEVLVVKSASSKVQKTLAGAIDGYAQRVVKFRQNEKVLERLTEKAGFLHLSNTHNSQSARMSAVTTEHAAVGYTWTPVQGVTVEEAEGLAVWLNSTLGRIAMRRLVSRSLTWPTYQPKALARIVVPDVRSEGMAEVLRRLRSAFSATSTDEVAQFRDGADSMRIAWDDAVSEATGIRRELIDSWRSLLDSEPTIRGMS